MIRFVLRLLIALPILALLLALGVVALAAELVSPTPPPRHSSLDVLETLFNRG